MVVEEEVDEGGMLWVEVVGEVGDVGGMEVVDELF